MYALEEWFSFQKNLLNLVRRSQAKREQFYDRKQREIEYLDHISSTVDEENVRRVIRNIGVNPGRLGRSHPQILGWEGRGISMKYYSIMYTGIGDENTLQSGNFQN